MSDKITDLKKAQQDKREKTGWTLEEIKKNASKELRDFKKLAEDEPENLASGDMQKIIDGEDDEEENDEPAPTR